MVQLLLDVAIPNTNRARRASRRPHFLVSPLVLGTVLADNSLLQSYMLEKAKERPDGWRAPSYQSARLSRDEPLAIERLRVVLRAFGHEEYRKLCPIAAFGSVVLECFVGRAFARYGLESWSVLGWIKFRCVPLERNMSLQLLLLGDTPVAQLVERARLAETNGYGAIWVADERFYREVYSSLSQLAVHSTKVLLGPCVTDPYARHPALTAMAIATLDEISGGRAILGIGAGISGFAELGIERTRPARAMRECIELIRALLRGETVDYHGEVITFDHGRLNFSPRRSAIPIYVASNGPLGQRLAAEIADGIIMQACASVAEVRAFRTAIEDASRRVGRDPQAVRIIARLNTCVSADGRAARDAVRPSVARYLGARHLRLRTAEAQELVLPAEALAGITTEATYAAGVIPYLSLLPLISDRHVDALTLAGTVDEVTEHAIALCTAGINSIIVRPVAPEPSMIEETILKLSAEVWPQVTASFRFASPGPTC